MRHLVHETGVTACGLAVVAAFLASSATPAATISGGVDKDDNHYLTLDGPIVAGDPERLAAAIFEASAHGYRLDALRLNSPGGAVWEAMAMAAMVRWVEDMATVVQKDAKCESACFALFAAGHRRYVDPTSDPTQIGVHSIYELISKPGPDGAPAFVWKETGDATIEAVRLLREVRVSASVIGKIVTTPPDKMLRFLFQSHPAQFADELDYFAGCGGCLFGGHFHDCSPACSCFFLHHRFDGDAASFLLWPHSHHIIAQT
jgi:hypothetical protein